MIDLISLFAIIGLAALVHASFQLSISVLTLLSGRTLSLGMSHRQQLRLSTAFVFGAGLITLLLISSAALGFLYITTEHTTYLIWVILCSLLLSIGIAVWLFYYRSDRGTSLWIPRGVATFLQKRIKATKQPAEAFSLGMTSVIAELLFIITPLVVAGYAISLLPAHLQPIGIVLYCLLSLVSLGIVWMLVGAGHKLSAIQKWREKYKTFLQFSAGSGLVILGFYIYVNEIVALAPGFSL